MKPLLLAVAATAALGSTLLTLGERTENASTATNAIALNRAAGHALADGLVVVKE